MLEQDLEGQFAVVVRQAELEELNGQTGRLGARRLRLGKQRTGKAWGKKVEIRVIEAA